MKAKYLKFFLLCGLFLAFYLYSPVSFNNTVQATHEECCPDDRHGADPYGCHRECRINIGGKIVDNTGAAVQGVRVITQSTTAWGDWPDHWEAGTATLDGDTTTRADGSFSAPGYDNATYSVRIDNNALPAGFVGPAKTTTTSWSKSNCTQADTPYGSGSYECQPEYGTMADGCNSYHPDRPSPHNNAYRCHFLVEKSLNSSSCESYTYPPDTVQARQTYPVVITMRNTGTTTWTSATSFRLGSQDPQDNSQWGMNRVALPNGQSVPPGSTARFSFDVTPQNPGKHKFSWKMVQDGVTWFNSQCPAREITVDPAPNPVPPDPPLVTAACTTGNTRGRISWTMPADSAPVTKFNVKVPSLGIDTDVSPTTTFINIDTQNANYSYTVTAFNGNLSSNKTGTLVCNCAGVNVPVSTLNVDPSVACGSYSKLNWDVTCADSVRVAYRPYNGYDPVSNATPGADGYVTLGTSAKYTYPNGIYVPGPQSIQVRLTATKGGTNYNTLANIDCNSGATPQINNVFHKQRPLNSQSPEIYRDNVQMTWEAYTPPAGQPAGTYHVIACPVAAGSKCSVGSRAVDRWIANTSYPQTFGTGIGLTFDTAYYWQVYWAPREGYPVVAYYTEDGWTQIAQTLSSP